MEIDFKHELPLADARARLEVLGEYLHNRHGIRVTWTDDGQARFHGKYMVVKIDGVMRLENGLVKFRGEDPGFLWRKKATEYIKGKLTSYLDPRTTLGDLPRGK
jgi:hypothetical protein